MRAVLHCSSGDPDDWEHALSNAANLLADGTLDLTDLAFVANGDAVRLLVEGSPHADRVATLRGDGVGFRACQNSLERRDLTDPLPGVERASSGVGELVKLQDRAYAYVRVP